MKTTATASKLSLKKTIITRFSQASAGRGHKAPGAPMPTTSLDTWTSVA
ncbi:hypothetical protein [Hymenobacter sp. B81]